MKAAFFVLLVLGSMGTGCATPVGALYSNTETPLQATASRAGTKVGEACATGLLFGLIAIGDRSIEAARRNGGINMITSVDETVGGSPLFYAEYCTVVRGR